MITVLRDGAQVLKRIKLIAVLFLGVAIRFSEHLYITEDGGL